VKPQAKPPRGRLWTWVAAGAAVAAGATATYYGLQQRSTQRDYLANKGNADDMLAKSRREAKTATVLWGVAGGLGAGAGALFFLEGSF